MNALYKSQHGGHHYHGRNIGRGCRRQSKMVKALKGVADTDLLDAVAREDARLRRERQQRQEQRT
jgi:hypothetical protein